ncbi:MAG: hypothetical protein J7530_18875 [Novosphingobium sp.]|nr:hypothetical protein [Novosphingobium sp.]
MERSYRGSRRLATPAPPIPIAADESPLTPDELPKLKGLFNMFSIKLDKCGEHTESLAMAAAAREAELGGQVCDLVDLDGPLFVEQDRKPGACFSLLSAIAVVAAVLLYLLDRAVRRVDRSWTV